MQERINFKGHIERIMKEKGDISPYSYQRIKQLGNKDLIKKLADEINAMKGDQNLVAKNAFKKDFENYKHLINE